MRIALACLDPGIPLDGTKGAAVHFRSLARALRRRGHRVDAVAMRLESPSAGSAARALDGVVDSVTIVPNGREAARAAIVALDGGEGHGALDAVYERLALFAAGALEAARELDVPHVLEVNAPLSEEAARWRGLGETAPEARAAERASITGADAVLPVSTALARFAIDLGARPERVRVVPNAVDPELFAPAERAPRRVGDTFTIGFVGSLKPWHGLVLLARALGIAARRGHDAWRLRVVGDGPERGALEKALAKESLFPARAELLGAVPHAEIPREMARLDAAVVPYEDLPGFYFSPLKLYEALACAVPVVASSVGDVPRELDGGRLGALVPPGDAEAFVDALRAIDVAPEKAHARALLASERIRTERTWERNAIAVEEAVHASRRARSGSGA